MVSDLFGLDVDKYTSKIPRPVRNTLSDIWKLEKRNFATTWDIVNTPISKRLGIDVPSRPGARDNLARIALEEGTRPLNYIPGLGLGGKLATKAPRGLRVASSLFGPVSRSTSLPRRLGAEAAVNIGARTGAESLTQLGEEAGITNPAARLGLGLGGALVGGGLTARGVAGRAPRVSVTEESIPIHISDTETERLTGVLTPSRYAPSYQDIQEAEYKLRRASDPQVSKLYKPEELYVFPQLKQATDVELLRDKTKVDFSGSIKRTVNTSPADEVAYDYIANWVGPTSTVRPFRALVDEVAKLKGPEALVEPELQVVKSAYKLGAETRSALRAIASPDGTINLYRGEARDSVFETAAGKRRIPIINPEGYRYPTIGGAQSLQSYTTSKDYALAVAAGSAPEEVKNTLSVIVRRVPIEDIVVAPYHPGFTYEHELLVLNHEQFDPDVWEGITGTPKPITNPIEPDYLTEIHPMLGVVGKQDEQLIKEAERVGYRLTPSMARKAASTGEEAFTTQQRAAIARAVEADQVATVSRAGETGDIVPPIESPTLATGGGGMQPPNLPPTTYPDFEELQPRRHFTDDDWEQALMGQEPATFPDGTVVSEINSPNIELQQSNNAAKVVTSKLLPLELQDAMKRATAARAGEYGIITKVNQTLKSIWATADASWFGIQGLLAIPDLARDRRFSDINHILRDSLTSWWDPSTFAIRVNRMNEVASKSGLPSIQELYKKGLELASISNTSDISDGIFPGATRSFDMAGDSARLALVYNELRRYGKRANIDDIIKAVNRATGTSGGGWASDPAARILLFAPRFLQSQLETVIKSATDFGQQGHIARRQLLTLVGAGVTLTWGINEARGKETVWDPKDSNFMRIRDVDGTDISLFGPWDSLVKAAVAIAEDPEEGMKYVVRTKASPLISTGINLWSGRNFLGGKMTASDHVKSLFLPFSAQDIGDEPPVASIAGFFGLKASPLSARDLMEDHMKEANLDSNDPLDRRTWLTEHPEDLGKATGEERELATTIQSEIGQRRATNDTLALNGTYTLVDWRENRKIIQRELRAKLDVIYANRTSEPKTKKEQWIKSWYELYEKAKGPINGDVMGDKLDSLQADWLRTNGTEAYTYVQAYNQLGKSDLELEYLTSINQLRDLGYFDMPRYRRMKSNLTDDEIDSARSHVSAARSTDRRLARLEFPRAAKKVLTEEGYSSIQIRDVVNAGRKVYANPTREKFNDDHPDLTIWFNPNARYENYQIALETATLRASRKGNITQPRINTSIPQLVAP